MKLLWILVHRALYSTEFLVEFDPLQFSVCVVSRKLFYCYIVIYSMIKTQWHRQTQEEFFNKICTSHFIARVRKGYSRFACERELETEHNWNILTPNLWPSTLCLSRSPDAQPEALGSTLLGAGLLYCILSATSLVLKLHRGSREPPRPGVAFPTTPRLTPTGTQTQLSWLLSWLSYIIVQRPLDRPLDLWNRMFNRHQAEITVIQFTGHSLPVHQSMSIPWEFF